MESNCQLTENYNLFRSELQKLKHHIDSLENEGENLFQGAKQEKDPLKYRNLYYKGIKQFESLIDRVYEINCSVELDPCDVPLKNSVNILDIPHLPNTNETKFEMVYLSGDSPWNFWLRHANESEFEILQTSLRKKLKAGELQPLDVKAVVGDYVCYQERKNINRAVVISCLQGDRLKILDIDISDVKVVKFQKLFKIDEEVVTVPAQGINCCLFDNEDDINYWTPELQKIFSSTLKHNKLTVEVVKQLSAVPSLYLVTVFVTDTSDEFEDGELNTIKVNDWVNKRIIPELKRNVLSKENELSIYALDAFCKEIDPNENSECNEGFETSDKCCFVSSDRKNLEENVCIEKFDGNKNSDIGNACGNVSSHVSNNLNSVVLKESNRDGMDQKLNELVSNKFEESNPNNVPGNKQFEVDNLSHRSLSFHSLVENQNFDFTEESGNENFDNASKCSSSSNSNVKSSKNVQEETQEYSTNKDNSTFDNNDKHLSSKSDKSIENFPTARSPFQQSSGCLNSNNLPDKTNLNKTNNSVSGKPAVYQFTGQPIMMGNNYDDWRGHYPVKPNYVTPPVPVQPRPLVVKGVLPLSYPNMNYWSRNDTNHVIPACNINGFQSWLNPNVNSHGLNFAANSSCTSSNVTISELQTQNHGSNKYSASPNEVSSIKTRDELIPIVETNYKVELKQQISLINPEEELISLISCVVSPDEIYIILANSNNAEIDSMESSMAEYYSESRHVFFNSKANAKSRLGRYCACYCTILNLDEFDEGSKWYRAEILNWDEDDGILVFLVDHGNKLHVKLTQIQPLFSEFATRYIMAQRCHLHRVKCPEGGWPESVNSYLCDLLSVNESYSVTVVPSCTIGGNKSLEVILYKRDDRSTSINNRVIEFLKDVAENDDNDRDVEIEEEIEFPVDNEAEAWDPMQEEFQSERNNYKIDIDDPCVAVKGYKPKDESRICKFFKQKGHCWKKECPMEHIRVPEGTFTTDKEEVFQETFTKLILPERGEAIKIKVTNVTNSNRFYCQIPASRILDEEEETISTLLKSLNNPKNVKTFQELECMPTMGQLILVSTKSGSRYFWVRAKVVEINEDSTCQVFYPDFGTEDTVSIKHIRAMEPKYLHLPFQCVECSLANLELKVNDVNEAICTLKEEIEHKLLNCIVSESFQDVQQLDVILLDEEIMERLENSGLYKIVERTFCDNETDDFIPG